ncbi:MAG: hypothetical protein OXR70_02265, partial [Candidatus Marinimicrobia bacterium]|nr:hypothetical protein [Candidatus Neomarinimicrobiota bacterium]
KRAIIKEQVGSDGEVTNRQYFAYGKGDKILRQFFLNNEQRPDSLIQYGMDEPWSEEFRKALPQKEYHYYAGQESKFILNTADQIESIRFQNLNGIQYGQIDFIYDHLGFLKGEVWTSIPNQRIIRRYAYAIDMLTGKKEIWEYDAQGQEVSHVALTRPPAERLYKTPPPRTGNRLDEISIILEDIREKDLKIPFDVFIPKTNYDLMVLTNGDSLMINLLEIGDLRMTFQIVGEADTLVMPKFRVESIMSKYGERIFP